MTMCSSYEMLGSRKESDNIFRVICSENADIFVLCSFDFAKIRVIG